MAIRMSLFSASCAIHEAIEYPLGPVPTRLRVEQSFGRVQTGDAFELASRAIASAPVRRRHRRVETAGILTFRGSGHYTGNLLMVPEAADDRRTTLFYF